MATLVDVTELTAALSGAGGALYGAAVYTEVADAASDLIGAYLVGGAASHADTPAVRLAALQLAVELFQARQTAAGTGSGIDLQPYRLGRTLVSRYQGMLAPYLDTGAMV